MPVSQATGNGLCAAVPSAGGKACCRWGSPLGKAAGAGDEDWGTADDDPAEDGGAGFQGSREAEGRRRDCWLRWHQASVPHVSLGLGEQQSWPPSPAVPRGPDKLFPPELPPPPPALFLLQHLGRPGNKHRPYLSPPVPGFLPAQANPPPAQPGQMCPWFSQLFP